MLLDNWREILTKAWSVKFTIAAVIFGAGEAIIAILQPVGVPTGILAGLSLTASVGSIFARAMAQGEDAKALAVEVAKEINDGKSAQ